MVPHNPPPILEAVLSIRKRTWGNHKQHEAWVVDYTDQQGKRRLKTFKLKRDADEYAATTRVQIGEGTHVPDRASATVAEACNFWLASCTDLEPTTVEQYRQHVRLHIAPYIGREKLSRLTTPFVSAFRDRLRKGDAQLPDSDLRKKPRSPAMVRGVMVSLGSILADAQERGLVVRNAVRELRRQRRNGGAQAGSRNHRKLQIGTDIPTPAEVKLLLSKAHGRWRPLLLVATFAGLRASELRGLRWDDMDLTKGEVRVSQRADRRNKIGAPKSKAGKRTIPLPPTVINELRQWKLICPKKDGKLSLVFPNGRGHVEARSNIVKRGLIPIMIAAELTKPILDAEGTPRRDENGKPLMKAKYSGLHTLRHFFASWCINRKIDGGLELPAKVVQERLGHASIVMTLDVYGHLFPRGDDSVELAKAESLFLN
jgi:integrase